MRQDSGIQFIERMANRFFGGGVRGDVRVGVWWGVPQTPTPPDCPSINGWWGIWVGVRVFLHKTSKNQQQKKYRFAKTDCILSRGRNYRLKKHISRILAEDSRILMENSRTSSHGKSMFLYHTDNTDFTDIFSNTNRTNRTNEGVQTWLCHTDNTDDTDIFANTNFTNRTKKARLRAFMQN